MMRKMCVLMLIAAGFTSASANEHRVVVAEKGTGIPLSNASVFSRNGTFIGVSGRDGSLPPASDADYPLTVRYIGYTERSVASALTDTVFMAENPAALPEVVIESRRRRYLHLTAYVREYSTLSTFGDSVFLFREKMVDFMLPADGNVHRGDDRVWTTPRILNTRSNYRFTNEAGLDSVSDRCNNYFSWADWIGTAPASPLPGRLRLDESASDTIRGKYSDTETWHRDGHRVTLDVNVMADTLSRRWVPGLKSFFRDNLDFEQLRLRFTFSNVAGDSVTPADLTGYSFNVESTGRARNMFMFNRVDQKFFVSTYAEVYIVDRELLTAREARRWEKRGYDAEEVDFRIPEAAPELDPAVELLVARVNGVDHDLTRLAIIPDHRLVGRIRKQHFGGRLWQMLKTITGVSYLRSQHQQKRNWKEFSRKQIETNRSHRGSDDD